MNIIPDPVLVAVQILPFLALMAGLHVILFKPMLAYLEQRHAATAGARAEAEKLQADSGAALDKVEATLAAARGEIAERRASTRATANAAHAEKVAAARSATDAQVAEALVRIREEAATARAQLGSDAGALANDMARQLLGRELSVEA